jgi:hypothetical protein
MEDGSEGLVDCSGTCSADTTGDTTCDAAFECVDTDWDGGDCEALVIGSDCETTDYYDAVVEGIVTCDYDCSSWTSWIDDGYCDPIFDCAGTDWDGGDCVEPGMACTMDDDTDGIYGCDATTCVADTTGDGTCDADLDCEATMYDGDDCEPPAPGDACTYDDWLYGSMEGIIDCDGECGSDGRGDGSCDDGTGYYGHFDCEALDWDLGDCIEPGDTCTMEDGSDGIYGCDSMTCVADTTGDGTCDEALDCEATAFDGDDCEPPGPGEDCTYEMFGSEYDGIVDCSGTCGSSYGLGTGYACDEDFDCDALGWDDGDCIEPGDACTTDDDGEGIYACDGTTCVADTTGDGTCDDALDCGDLSYDGDDCEISACYETDLGSALGTALATGSSVEFTSSSIEGSCFTGVEMTEGIWGWTAPTAGTFCFDLRGSGYDTSLAIFDEGCGVELACDEDSGPSYTSYTSVDLTEGQFVSVVIDAYGSTSEGDYSLDITEGACL